MMVGDVGVKSWSSPPPHSYCTNLAFSFAWHLIIMSGQNQVACNLPCLFPFLTFFIFYFYFLYKIKILLQPNLNVYVCEVSSQRLESQSLSPTPHKHLYMWSYHCTKGVWRSLSSISTPQSAHSKGKQRRGNMKENFPSPSKTDTSLLMPFFFRWDT